MRLRTVFVFALPVAIAAACSSADKKSDEAEAPPPSSGEFIEEPAQPGPLEEPGEPLASAEEMQDLEGSLERQQVLSQRREFLVEQYLALGDERYERADLEGALEQYAQALDVDPSSQEARDSIRRVESLMGDRFARAADFMEDATTRESVRRAQARIAITQAVEGGNTALVAGDFETAIDQYSEAQLILRYHPLIADETNNLEKITGLLNDAIDLQGEAEMEAERMREQRAQMAKTAREDEEREYTDNQMTRLYAEANSAFLRDDFKVAEDLARQILLLDQHNEAAMSLADAARIQRHRQTDQQNRANYREQWIRTFEELDTMDVPQIEVLRFDDLKRWKEVRDRQPLEFQGQNLDADLEREAVVQRLDGVRFAPNFIGPDGEGAPLEEIATFLQNLSGVNFIVSTAVREDLDEEETTIKLQLNERSVRKVLDIISETSESLRWKIEDGVVKFVTQEEMLGGQRLHMYEVRDVIHPVPDYPSKEINVSPSGGLEPVDEDIDEREGLVVTSDALETLIRDNIAPESWDDDPRNSIRVADNGTLVVNQTPEVHEQIEKLLADLRESVGIMVDIQSNFLRVEDNFLEDIGVDFRGLGQPGQGTNQFFNDFGDTTTQQTLGNTIGQDNDLGVFYDDGDKGDLKARTENLYDAALGDEDVLTGSGGLALQWTYLDDLQVELILRAVSKSERIELVTAPRLLVYNTARSNISVLNQVAYVSDYDVEIAQGASIADPIIEVIQDGVVLDVRPVVSADRRFILMELRPTVASLQRPILEVPTSLGTQQTVTIQLPDVDIQRVRTTVPMPDGGTVMLGGLKMSTKQDLQSGIPIINKIPIVSFLFERKGTFIANQKLLILIKARIVIPSEHEPTQSQLGPR